MPANTTPIVAPVASPEEVKSFREEQAAEWGQYVAVQPITLNGALAYNAGDPVPASNVKVHKYDEQGLVAKVGTKAVTELVTSLNTAQPNQVVDVGSPVSLGVTVPDSK